MNDLKAGFAREVINPAMGIQMAGYGDKPRKATGILDDLELNVIALQAGGKTALILAYDLCQIFTAPADSLRAFLAEKLNLPVDALFATATHTHTGPTITPEYLELLKEWSLKAAKAAIADLKPAKMGFKVGFAPEVAFVRRFRMKDGSVQTNPGVGNPDILAPIGDVDRQVPVLRFDREGGETIVLVNFGNHPDTIGSTKLSADWPGFLRRTVEKTLEDTRCVFINGAEGDINHINVNAKDGDLNGVFNDFDDVIRGYDHARFMGRAMAGTVLQVYDKMNYREVDGIHYRSKIVNVPGNVPKPEEMEQAYRYAKLYDEGRAGEIPYKGMQLTTVVFEAKRMIRMEHGPEILPVSLAGLGIGPVALIGVQGEPFNAIGKAWKEAEEWEQVLPVCNTNGKEGYFPTAEAYAEGGYEARSSIFKGGVAEMLIAEGRELLKELKEA